MRAPILPQFGKNSATWSLSLALLLAITLLYMHFLWNPLVFDDNPFFNGVTPQQYGHSNFDFSLRWIPYASLGWTANWFGLDLIGFRMGNMGLHIANAIILFLLLRRLFGIVLTQETPAPNTLSNHWMAFFGALLFALHPVAVYAVGYLIQRTILMATLFSLLSWSAYLEGLISEKARWFALSIICYFLAVFSKEHAVMAPAIAFAITLLLKPPSPALLRRLAPTFTGFAIIAAIITFKVKGLVGEPYERYALDMLQQIEKPHEGIVVTNAYPLSVMTQCFLFFKYLLLWLIPNPAWMSIDMREPFAAKFMDWPYVAGTLCYVTYGVIAVWLLLRRGMRGLVGFSMLFPWLLFATELSTVRIQEPFVLYRSYFWMGGIYAALPVLFNKTPAKHTFIVLLSVSLMLIPLSWDRLTTFSHSLLVWDDAATLIQDKPVLQGSERIYHNRGLALFRVNLKQEAMADYTKALSINPNYGQVYNDRGAIYYDLGRYQEALYDFDTAIALLPNYARSYAGRGLVLDKLGKPVAAKENYFKACALGMSAFCAKAY